MIYVETSLKLLAEKFRSVAKSPYFNVAIEKYANWFAQVIEKSLDAPSPEVLQFLYEELSIYYLYLKGSSMNETPYEIEYSMHQVLNEWFPDKKFGIATALVSDFHMLPTRKVDGEKIVDFIPNLVGGCLNENQPEEELILMGLPNLFNHTPLFCIALFHELGHFVDMENGITEETMMNNPRPIEPNENPTESLTLDEKEHNYRREHFADIFASCYIGDAINKMLVSEAPNAPYSDTHPSTDSRINFVTNFLNNPDGNEFEMYQDVLSSLNLPKLEKRFETPQLEDEFNDARPYKIETENIKELHGILLASWEYLENIENGNCPDWASELSLFDRVRIVNNLVEKSIRNHSTKTLWNGVEIRNTGRSGLWIDPLLEESQIGELTIDLRLGCDFLVSVVTRRPFIGIDSSDEYFRPLSSYFQSTRRELGDKFILYPNQVAITCTLEYIGIPENCYANLYTRSSYARLGISISGAIIEPGFRGCLSIELFNNGNNPIQLIVGTRMFQMELKEISDPTRYHTSNRKYFGNTRPILSRADDDHDLEKLNNIIREKNTLL